MLRASVERTQHAVGHGGFHTGNIKIFEHYDDPAFPDKEIKHFSYVYDCGSLEPRAFKNALAAYGTISQGRTDILFVSHLHSDHISGIEKLQAIAPAETVVVPYLDTIERLLLVLSDFEEGSASTSLLEYLRDPVIWWLRRGAQQIIFIQPGRPDGDEPPIPPPDVPDIGGDDAGYASKGKMGARLARHLRAPIGPTPTGLIPATEREQNNAAIFAGPGSSLRIECWDYNVAHDRVCDWILLPYVHPQNEVALSEFRREIRKALQTYSRSEATLTRLLIEFLSTYAERKRLMEIYAAHFGHGHNALSMSLYSGPFVKTPNIISRQLLVSRENRPRAFVPTVSAGWLGTGDAALKEKIRREPWLKFFKSYGDSIGVMALPHHGSARNFHEEILEFKGLGIALATTIESREIVARMPEVLSVVEAHGISTQIVDDEYKNGFRTICSLQVRP